MIDCSLTVQDVHVKLRKRLHRASTVHTQPLAQIPILSAFSNSQGAGCGGEGTPESDKEKDFFLFSTFLEKSRQQFYHSLFYCLKCFLGGTVEQRQTKDTPCSAFLPTSALLRLDAR